MCGMVRRGHHLCPYSPTEESCKTMCSARQKWVQPTSSTSPGQEGLTEGWVHLKRGLAERFTQA